MPTVFRTGPYRFFFYSNENDEPPHIHVREGRKLAKFWIEPVLVASSTGFVAHELRRIQSIVIEKQAAIMEAWHGHFTDHG